MLCFVLTNSVILNVLCVWIFHRCHSAQIQLYISPKEITSLPPLLSSKTMAWCANETVRIHLCVSRDLLGRIAVKNK